MLRSSRGREEERQAERHGQEPLKRGRPSYRFLLREPHPLHNSWVIVKMKEKWGVLVPCGAPPPAG